MRRWIEQGVVFVLSVKLDQPAREILERAGRRQLAVDEGAASALRGDLAADEQFFAAGFEDRLNGGDLLARANEVAGRPAAQQKPDRLDEDRLAGPGFAREHVEAGLELDLGGVDYSEAFDAEKAKHGGEKTRSSIVT